MNGRIERSKEEKERDLLRLWGEDDNRPFIRIKENKRLDKLEYQAKGARIKEELLEVSYKSGTPIEKISLIDPWGHVYSDRRPVKEFGKPSRRGDLL